VTPEEFLAAIAAIHRYMREVERPVEITRSPEVWKLAQRVEKR
jgi:hypothetical protein